MSTANLFTSPILMISKLQKCILALVDSICQEENIPHSKIDYRKAQVKQETCWGKGEEGEKGRKGRK